MISERQRLSGSPGANRQLAAPAPNRTSPAGTSARTDGSPQNISQLSHCANFAFDRCVTFIAGGFNSPYSRRIHRLSWLRALALYAEVTSLTGSVMDNARFPSGAWPRSPHPDRIFAGSGPQLKAHFQRAQFRQAVRPPRCVPVVLGTLSFPNEPEQTGASEMMVVMPACPRAQPLFRGNITSVRTVQLWRCWS